MTTPTSAFTKNIASDLSQLEAKRAKLSTIAKRRMSMLKGIASISSIVLALMAWWFFDSLWVSFGVIFCAFIAFMLFEDTLIRVIVSPKVYWQFEKLFKEKVIGPIVNMVDESWQYEAKGSLPQNELEASELFYIGRNTTIEIDDLISGQLQDHNITIANVKTTSVPYNDGVARKNVSEQSFNGTFVRLQVDLENTAFFIPKAKTQSSVNGVAGLKLARDPNLTMQQQRAQNLSRLMAGTGGYTWHTGLAKDGHLLDLETIDQEGFSVYLAYTKNLQFVQRCLLNPSFQGLLRDPSSSSEELLSLSNTPNFTVLDPKLLDKLMADNITVAIHSGYVWILIPSFSDKFEIDLHREMNEALVYRHYQELMFAKACAQTFVDIYNNDY
jgi:hypothetical protein